MKLLIANWKSNKTQAEVFTWLESYTKLAPKLTRDVQVAIAPALSQIGVLGWYHHSQLNDSLKAFTVLAAQDISPFPAGSYTGAVSAYNLRDLAVQYALVGHSERRHYFHESHQDVAAKVAQCLENRITPVVCVDDEYIAQQAAALSSEHLSKCLVAYEALAAIGTGNPTEPALVKESVARIKTAFGDVKVLYGGSLQPGNAAKYFELTDGGLVGSASLDAAQFVQILQQL